MTEYKLKIMHDSDHDARGYDHVGTMVCWHRRYNLGDEQPKCDPQQWREDFDAENPDAVILPLYLYDHGGLSISVGGFACPWDRGQVGWIYITRKALDSAWPAEYPEGATSEEKAKLDAGRIAKAEACLRAEVKEYDDCLTGNVWGFRLYKLKKCGECGHIEEEETDDSCWGFVGDKEHNGMRDALPSEALPLFDAAWEHRYD